MKKLLFTGLFLLCCLWLHAQNVTGKVYREGTNTVIAGATVYYGGSMAGTITNNDGRFELQAKPEQIPVIVSCIGYYSSTVTYKPGQPLIVYLKPKQEQLKMVTIRADGMARSEEIALFIREFIGISDYARSCTITNIDDVDFFYDRKTETLTASSDKPLIIENKKLGYTINYYLDTFARTSRNVYYAGNYIFKDDMPATVQAQAKIKSNRENVYQFSRMQLIRILWSRSLKKSGFRIYTPYFKPLTEDSLILRNSSGEQYLELTGRVIIAQSRNVRNDLTSLSQIKDLTFIDKDGYYGSGLKWSGQLTLQRIGDLLPFEYQSEKELKNQQTEPDVNAIATVAESNIAVAASKDKGDALSIPPNKTIIPDNTNWKQFASIALMPNNGSDSSLVVKKWEQTIRYKIYSRFNNKGYDKILTGYINQVLKKVSGIANRDIVQTNADDLVNLYIVIGKPAEFANVLPPDAVQYFNITSTNSCYYAATENGFSRMVACINPGNDFSLEDKTITKPMVIQNEDAKAGFAEALSAGTANNVSVTASSDGSVFLDNGNTNARTNSYSNQKNDSRLQTLWYQARQVLMKSFGFAGVTDTPNSLFSSSYNVWMPDDKISPSDTRIIQALYSPKVKSGMHEQEVYAVVKGMFTK